MAGCEARPRQPLAAAAGAGEGEVVLGVDTIVVVDGEIFGKPPGPDAAAAILHPVHVHEGAWLVTGIAMMGIAVNNASWSLAGASQALMFSEDMKHPRTIGRIMMIALAEFFPQVLADHHVLFFVLARGQGRGQEAREFAAELVHLRAEHAHLRQRELPCAAAFHERVAPQRVGRSDLFESGGYVARDLGLK